MTRALKGLVIKVGGEKVDINEPVGQSVAVFSPLFHPPPPSLLPYQMARLADSPHVPNEMDPFLSRHHCCYRHLS